MKIHQQNYVYALCFLLLNEEVLTLNKSAMLVYFGIYFTGVT